MTEITTVPVGDMKVRVSGTGFPLILLHGYTTTSEFWREQVEELSRSYQVIRPNLPGHGISPAPVKRHYTIDAFVADLEGLFQHFSLRRAALVGLSMGGVISQHFALRNPQLLQALVLVDTTSHGIGQNARPETVLAGMDAVGVEKALQKLSDDSFSPGAPRALLEWAEQEVIQTPEFVARAAITSLGETDTTASLGRIAAPTLVIVGEMDTVTPVAESKALSEGIPNSKLVVIEKAGHFSMLERPVEFNRALRGFLDQHLESSRS
jgi:pimeloyl-ACP methyl ester carboxylesterase